MSAQPPQRALKFLCWFCREDYLEEIAGNLTELYEKRYKISPSKAKMLFVLDVLKHLHPLIIRPIEGPKQLNLVLMFKNYFRVSVRTLVRNKMLTAIQIAGFSLGIASFIIATQSVLFEYSFDQFHAARRQAGTHPYPGGSSVLRRRCWRFRFDGD